MATREELRRLASELASRRYDESVQAIVDAAEGNHEALAEAARELAADAQNAGSFEHIAFTYLSAAYAKVADAKLRGRE